MQSLCSFTVVNSRVLPLAFLLLSGCAGQQKFDANSAITVRSGGFGNTYEQAGRPLDRGDMLDKLSEWEPTKADADSAKTLGTVATVIGAVGGALVGWPIGAAIAGSREPPWVLAGIGAGVIAVSIPFSIAAGNRVESAVESHNRLLRPMPSSGAKPTQLPSKTP
ncbi:MAG TPA: hypothetical protein VKP30_15790 [Polyangiaceae bacterium]|nr:hypothetical protein [Polyangiaceae bacterium]